MENSDWKTKLIFKLGSFLNFINPKKRYFQSEYYIVTIYLDNGIEEYRVRIQSRYSQESMIKTLSEICKDRIILAKLDQDDLTRITYLTDTFQMP